MSLFIPIRHIGTTYPLDLVRSRLSIATASIPLSQSNPLPTTSAVKPALASAYHTSSAPAAASSAARAVAATFTKADLTMWGMTLKVMREEGGVRALYRGLIPTAMGVAPYVGKLRRLLVCEREEKPDIALNRPEFCYV